MSYLGIDPSLRAYKQALFRASGGEVTLPIKIDVEALVIKNGSLLIPDNDYYISNDNRITVSKPALKGDEYFVINLSTFSFDGMATKQDLQDAIANIEQQPLFFVMWWPKRSTIPAGFVPADGQLELRQTYKEAAEGIDLGQMPFVDDADWLANKALRASFTKGDGTTNFRVPDYNGKSVGGSAAVVLRGDGLNAAPEGTIQSDAIGRHAHSLNLSSNSFGSDKRPADPFNTATTNTRGLHLLPAIFDAIDPINKLVRNEHYGSATSSDGSNISSVENRMVNATGCWCIRLAHKVVATGALDANGVVQTVNNHTTQITELSKRVVDVEQEVATLKADLQMGKWYNSSTPEFQSRVKWGPGWYGQAQEMMFKETEHEIRIKGIVRRNTAAFSKDVVFINNPEHDRVMAPYSPVLTSETTIWRNTYFDSFVSTDSVYMSLPENAPAFSGWIMMEITIAKNPAGF